MHPDLPERLQALVGASSPELDPALTWDELVRAVGVLTEVDLSGDEHAALLAFLEVNLPGARLGDLLDWPGEWFGNRWLEEVVLEPEELSVYALARSGRELPGTPAEPELPFPIPEG